MRIFDTVCSVTCGPASKVFSDNPLRVILTEKSGASAKVPVPQIDRGPSKSRGGRDIHHGTDTGRTFHT